MGTLLRFLFKPIGFILGGLVVTGIGAFMYWNGTTSKPPERSELTEVKGVVSSATKVSRKKYGATTSVKYELVVTSADGTKVTLTLPSRKITEDQAATLVDRPIVALTKGTEGKVWELTSGIAKFVDYTASRQDEADDLVFQAQNGPYAGGAGIVLVLLGIYRFTRRREDA